MQFLKPAGHGAAQVDARRARRPRGRSSSPPPSPATRRSSTRRGSSSPASPRARPIRPGGRIDHDPDGEPNGLLQDTAAGPVYRADPAARRRSRPPASSSSPAADARLQPRGDHELHAAGRRRRADQALPSPQPGPASSPPARTSRSSPTSTSTRPRPRGRSCSPASRKLRRQVERSEELPRSVTRLAAGQADGAPARRRPGVAVDAVKIFLDGIASSRARPPRCCEPYLGSERAAAHRSGGARRAVRRRLDARPDGHRRSSAAASSRTSTRSATALSARRWTRSPPPARRTASGTRTRRSLTPRSSHPADYKRFGEATTSPPRWGSSGPSRPRTRPRPSSRTCRATAGTCTSQRADHARRRPRVARQRLLPGPVRRVVRPRGGDPARGRLGRRVPAVRRQAQRAAGPHAAQGIRAVTINAAYQMHQEKVTGSLEKGKLADLVVLDQNITKVPRDDISDTDVADDDGRRQAGLGRPEHVTSCSAVNMRRAGLISLVTWPSPRPAPAAAADRVFTVQGATAPGPARLDRIRVIEQGPRHARNMLVLVPGTSGGAAYFRPVAARPRQAAAGLARVVGRPAREPARGPLGARPRARRQGDAAGPVPLLPRVARRPVDLAALHAGRRRRGPVRAALGHGRRDPRPAQRRPRRPRGGNRVVLGGHSLGGTITVAYATWDFGGRAGARDLDGLVLIDGGSGRTLRAHARRRAAAARASQTGSPFLDLTGLGLPWSARRVQHRRFDRRAARPGAPGGARRLAAAARQPQAARAGHQRRRLRLRARRRHVARQPEPRAHAHRRAGAEGDPRPGSTASSARSSARRRCSPASAGSTAPPGTTRAGSASTAAAVDGGVRNPAQKVLGVRATHGDDVRLPIYAIETSLGAGRVLKGARGWPGARTSRGSGSSTVTTRTTTSTRCRRSRRRTRS